MIAIISPALQMKDESETRKAQTVPIFEAEARELLQDLEKLQPWDIQTLMRVNDTLATQVFLDYQNFGKKKGTPAIFAFDGLVYQNIEPESLNEKGKKYLQDHLRILSGLYGVLRPLDEIWPYRLEMGSSFKKNGKSLYHYWSDTLAKEIFNQGDPVINLASQEYSRIIKKYKQLENTWIDIEFKTMRKGKLRTIVAWAKMARGQMIRYMAKNQLTKPEQLKEFTFHGYKYETSLSTKNRYVFVDDSI